MTDSNAISDKILARRPGMSLEQAFYRDAAIFERDVDRIFMQGWLFAGHISRISNPGDYFLFQIADESLIVIRDRDDSVRALFNVCRHRGSRICTTPAGTAKALVCPYHLWTYKLNGELLSARHMPADFEKADYPLVQAHVRVLEGLIFVCLSDTPPDFDAVEADIVPQLRLHRLDQAKVCRTWRYRIRANWKLVVENSRECYHCGPAHPEYCGVMGFAAGIDAPRIAEEDAAISAESEARWRALGLNPRHVGFELDTWHHVVRFPFRRGLVSQSLDGQAVAPVMGDLPERDTGALAIVIYPSFWFEASSDYAMIQRFVPEGPVATGVEMYWLVRHDAVAGRDYDVEKVTGFWRRTAEQDKRICENNQAGVNSRRYRPGPYSPIESEVDKFISWYLSRVA